MGRKEEALDAKTAYGGADHRGVEGCPGRGQCPGPVPEARHLGRDIPYMADEICRPSSQRREEAAPTGRGKPAVDADGDGAGVGDPGAEGNHRQKLVRP